MFGLFKKKKDKAHVLGAPAKGKAVSLKEVSDPTFSEGILGDGVAVIPSEGKIYAPADGTIGMVFDTLHAISLTTDFGAEVLIHVGLDTVQLKGEGFFLKKLLLLCVHDKYCILLIHLLQTLLF